jgi:hypothetical protein
MTASPGASKKTIQKSPHPQILTTFCFSAIIRYAELLSDMYTQTQVVVYQHGDLCVSIISRAKTRPNPSLTEHPLRLSPKHATILLDFWIVGNLNHTSSQTMLS